MNSTRFLILIFGFLILILLIQNSHKIHWTELNWKLQRISFLESKTTSNHLIAKLTNQMLLYRDEIEQSEVDEIDYEIQTNLSKQKNELDEQIIAQSLLYQTNRNIINTLRSFSSIRPLPNEIEINNLKLLGKAFILESRNQYRDAIAIYDNLVTNNSNDRRLVAISRLHRGFCFSMLNNNPQAKADYQFLLDMEKNSDLSVTAILLLNHQNQLIRETEKILREEKNTLAKITKLVKLDQCKIVANLLENYDPNTEKDDGKIKYLKGICLEKSGEKEKAIQQYISAIKTSEINATSHDANRRILYLASEFDKKQGGEIREFAIQLNQILKDPYFEQAEKKIRTKNMEIQADLKIETLKKNIELDSLFSLNQSEIDSNLSFIQELYNDLKNTLIDSLASSGIDRDSSKILQKNINKNKMHNNFVLTTQDDRIFIGQIINSRNSKIIKIQTMVGLIGIPKNSVREIKDLNY